MLLGPNIPLEGLSTTTTVMRDIGLAFVRLGCMRKHAGVLPELKHYDPVIARAQSPANLMQRLIAFSH